ncbi:E3 ubiquitin-protein ligase rnf146 [Frankliniella occidentalis]|uniref:E3 ubiquitin-protein ligase n=1 Tax=Frankliniella occidentalis TaxID=133901 RepID=A0A6J1SN43_FRAOC|nr:E3 ubiquitin-protein ligase rnf146 [Frankliniella occidentalis]
MAESLRTSKDNNNEKHRKRQKSREKGEMGDSKSVEEGVESVPECAVCLQTCVHPAKLPCSHIFCFLCLKGLATQSRRCAMCRQDIPLDYLDHPQLLEVPTQAEKEALEDGYQWFYEGRSGWWQYDERTSRELELAFKNGQRTCELLIVGQLYIADFDAMLQLRRNDMSRRRRIKRDLASIPKKGVAGLRLEGGTTTDNAEVAAVPSTSQLPQRRESDLTQSLEMYNEQRQHAVDLPSSSYRNVEELDYSEEVDSGEIHQDSLEERQIQEQIEQNSGDDSDSEQTELASQLNDLWLNQ